MSFLPEGFTPSKDQDGDFDFKPFKGKYIGKIESISRDEEPWKDGSPKDQIKMTIVIEKTIEGDPAENRKVFLQWSMIDTKWQDKVTTGAEHRARLINALCTAGYDVDCSSEEAFYKSVFFAVETKCNISCWGQNGKQRAKIVEEFKLDGTGEVRDSEGNFPF